MSEGNGSSVRERLAIVHGSAAVSWIVIVVNIYAGIAYWLSPVVAMM